MSQLNKRGRGYGGRGLAVGPRADRQRQSLRELRKAVLDAVPAKAARQVSDPPAAGLGASKRCYYCETTEQGTPDTELRPYGPGGAWVCFPCVLADPEREQAAKRVFFAQLEAAAAMSPSDVAILDGEGPQPAPLLDDGLETSGPGAQP